MQYWWLFGFGKDYIIQSDQLTNKKTNQECYLIFSFIETSVLAYVDLLYTVVLLVAPLSKNLLLINSLLIFNVLSSIVKLILPLILGEMLLTSP
jgi:hypothetical protein